MTSHPTASCLATARLALCAAGVFLSSVSVLHAQEREILHTEGAALIEID